MPPELNSTRHFSTPGQLQLQGAGLAGGVAVAGGALGWSLSRGPAAQPEPTVVLGDGIRVPSDMAWIAGRDFLMGSNLRLARFDERPTRGATR